VRVEKSLLEVLVMNRLHLIIFTFIFSTLTGTASVAAPDLELDGIPNNSDNCIFLVNAAQGDADLDGIGNICDGDLNQDRFVGGPDFSLFSACFGQPALGSCAAADMDGNSTVDGADFPLFLAGFNAKPGPAAGAEVHGHVSASFASNESFTGSVFRLPDVTVYLKDVVTGRRSREAVTDAHGYFAVPTETRGTYELCMEADNFVATCDGNPINLTHENYSRPSDFLIPPKPAAIYGRLLQHDPVTTAESPCFRENVAFGLLEHPRVTLSTLSGTEIQSVRGNNRGEYLIPAIPTSGSFRLKATCGDQDDDTVVSASGTSIPQEINFAFPNGAPRIRSIVARLNGTAVRSASTGEILEVTVLASDPDGDPLHYRWGSTDPAFQSIDAPNIQWTLGNAPARESIYVEVFDSKGGFATQKLSIPTETNAAHFNGVVIDADTALPISGVAVSVNGARVDTTANGFFSIETEDTARYVLNSAKFSYVFQSHVFHASTANLEIRMQQVPVHSFDPTQAVAFTTSQERDPLQGSIQIPPNCLVGKDGSAAVSPLSASFYTYDPAAENGIPGDYSAIDSGGNDVRLESYGTWGIDIWDSSDQAYNLKPGCLADFALEVAGAQQSSAPATIPLLEYDIDQGYWIEAAPPAQLVAGEYRGLVPAFSQWNTDVEFSSSACIAVEVDEDRTNYPFNIRVTIPTGSGVDKIKEFPVTERYNGLFRLPPNETITIEMLPNSGPAVVLKTITADSGNSILEAFPLFPYSDCLGFDTATGLSPVVLALDLPLQNSIYLSRKGGFYNDPDPVIEGNLQDAEALEYYTNIGMFSSPNPLTRKDTLSGWLNANGFPTGDVSAIYFNNLDLQFGRQMHCRELTGGGLACYVTNFGSPGGPVQPALNEAIADVNEVATVTMEFDPTIAEGQPNRIKFYVYDAAGNYATRAALDSQGLKPVPHICLVCHGGIYDATDNDVIGGAFREFDVFGFEFDEVHGFTKTNQEEAFRQLNAMVKATAPNADNADDPIVDLIDGLYHPASVEVAGAVAVDTYVPDDTADPPNSWAVKPALYSTIVKKYCRACHVAQSSYIDFFNYGEFDGYKGSIDTDVCSSLEMPHAEAAFVNLWLSTDPAAAHYLADSITGLGFTDPTCPKP
jgi:hypothetical protein